MPDPGVENVRGNSLLNTSRLSHLPYQRFSVHCGQTGKAQSVAEDQQVISLKVAYAKPRQLQLELPPAHTHSPTFILRDHFALLTPN